jgi:hypothetical protein
MIRLCVVLDSSTSEACDEFVDISYTLNWAKWMTIPKRWYERLVFDKEIQLTQCSNIFLSRPSIHNDRTLLA